MSSLKSARKVMNRKKAVRSLGEKFAHVYQTIGQLGSATEDEAKYLRAEIESLQRRVRALESVVDRKRWWQVWR